MPTQTLMPIREGDGWEVVGEVETVGGNVTKMRFYNHSGSNKKFTVDLPSASPFDVYVQDGDVGYALRVNDWPSELYLNIRLGTWDSDNSYSMRLYDGDVRITESVVAVSEWT